MAEKTTKRKMIIFIVNTLRQPLYVVSQATKSTDESNKDTLVFIVSTDEAALKAEEPDTKIQKISAQNSIVAESNYALYKINVLRDEDLIFDGQYSYHNDERIAVVTLVKRELANLN